MGTPIVEPTNRLVRTAPWSDRPPSRSFRRLVATTQRDGDHRPKLARPDARIHGPLAEPSA
ncbi:MAG TPA: hypothetical protein DCQ98_22480 [Planctomycetaceae bacterium]|nr:hypothetical protein [Planctomycetaceae bacterium]